jgi:chromosome segregation ATPase
MGNDPHDRLYDAIHEIGEKVADGNERLARIEEQGVAAQRQINRVEERAESNDKRLNAVVADVKGLNMMRRRVWTVVLIAIGSIGAVAVWIWETARSIGE